LDLLVRLGRLAFPDPLGQWGQPGPLGLPALAGRTRAPHLVVQLIVAYGVIRLWDGGLDEALERSEGAARLADDAGETGSWFGARVALSYAHILTGRLREALAVADESLVLAHTHPEAGPNVLGIVPHVFFFMVRGEALMEMGRLDESASTLERAAKLAREFQAGELLGWIHSDLAELLARRAICAPRSTRHPARSSSPTRWALRSMSVEHVSSFAEKLVWLLQRHRDCALAFGRREFELADEESYRGVGDFFERRYPQMLAPFEARSRAVGKAISPAVMIEEAMRFGFINLIGEPSFCIVRRDYPAVAQGFAEGMQQMIDWEFFTRFFADGPIARCHDVVGTYHIHARGSSLANARFARHYHEYDYLIGVTLARFARQLAPDQVRALEERRVEVQRLALEQTAKKSE
jgi:tetratricopeptide (TPR) repeat protein